LFHQLFISDISTELLNLSMTRVVSGKTIKIFVIKQYFIVLLLLF